jgi:hypothetical protein
MGGYQARVAMVELLPCGLLNFARLMTASSSRESGSELVVGCSKDGPVLVAFCLGQPHISSTMSLSELGTPVIALGTSDYGNSQVWQSSSDFGQKKLFLHFNASNSHNEQRTWW